MKGSKLAFGLDLTLLLPHSVRHETAQNSLISRKSRFLFAHFLWAIPGRLAERPNRSQESRVVAVIVLARIPSPCMVHMGLTSRLRASHSVRKVCRDIRRSRRSASMLSPLSVEPLWAAWAWYNRPRGGGSIFPAQFRSRWQSSRPGDLKGPPRFRACAPLHGLAGHHRVMPLA
jgi:hypothetical protein